MSSEVKGIYPAHSATGSSYTGSNQLYLHQGQPDDEWHPDVVLRLFMLLWHDDHTDGSRKLTGWPSAHFAFGFSQFASNALLHELWGLRLNRPLNRRMVAAGLALSTLEEIEDSDVGVDTALRLLRSEGRKGWWSHLFGTAQTYPDNRLDDDGDGDVDHPDEVGVKYRLDGRRLPSGPNSLSLWDMLRTYRANPAKGWNTDLQVGDPTSSVLLYIDRAVDIHDLGEDVGEMLKRCIDPLAIDEPFESLPQI
jgi:hypothetical protein